MHKLEYQFKDKINVKIEHTGCQNLLTVILRRNYT